MADSAGLYFPTSERLTGIGLSPILAAVNRVSQLRNEGHTIHALTAGEPDFDTPQHIIDAAINAMRRGETHYTPVAGTIALREAIQRKFKRDNDLDFTIDEVIASAGSKQVLANAFGSTLNPDDEVLIPTPYWTAYPDMVRVFRGSPVFIHTTFEQEYKISPTALDKSITPQTRWLILNSPCNPSGAVYSKDELSDLATVLREHPRVAIISDDIYEHIRFDNTPYPTIAAVCPDIAHRVLTINGLSKSFAMTGWRVGYAGGAASLIKNMAILQSQGSLAPCSIAQAAAAAALDGPMESVKSMVATYKTRASILEQIAQKYPAVSISKPKGAFYSLFDLSDILSNTTQFDNSPDPKDFQFTKWLLDTHKVAVVPGSAFGVPGAVRVSFATDEDTIKTGVTELLNATTIL